MKRAVLAWLIGALLIGCSTPAAIKAIADLNDAALPAGTYRVVGYLVFLDDCGFCPPGAVCEPCAGPTFSVLAERDRDIEWSNSTQAIVAQLEPDDLLLSINLDSEDRLVQGARYEMTIELADATPYEGSNRVAFLVDFSQQG